MNKVLLIILSVILLSACSKVFTQKHLASAQELCDNKGGIYSLVINDNDRFVYCKNGDVEKIL